jgi:hypothetical protein
VELTRGGRSLVAKIRRNLVAEYEEVLRHVPKESREAVIATISHLLAAFVRRQERSCVKPESQRTRRRAGADTRRRVARTTGSKQ